MLAVESLGAEGVQIGTRFALTQESSASEAFKNLCLNLQEGDTKLLLKKLGPTRLVKNDYRTAIEQAEDSGATADQLREIIGKGKTKLGIFEGDIEKGELEIGQVTGLLQGISIQKAGDVVKQLVDEYKTAQQHIGNFIS
jgi:enoyl-[acyl-carrier protein] reductase II